MSTLYVTETGVQVHTQGQRLLIKRGQEVLQDIPMINVDRVVLMGRGVSITTPTLYALARRRVGVYYLNSGGRFILRAVGQEHHHSQLRYAQAHAVDDPARSMAIARAIVDGKVKNQRVLVQRHAEGALWAQKALKTMDGMRRQVLDAKNLDELRGREGLAAKEYFSIMRQLIHKPVDGQSWGFERRAYYPPTDPINALLSFGYTLLLNDLVAACQISGLDPDIGFFHGVQYNKPSMALDLEEEFRSIIVDSIVMTAVNRHYFRLRDFEIGQPYSSRKEPDEENALLEPEGSKESKDNNKSPILMKEDARKRFINLYETRVNEGIIYPPSGEQTSYRRIFELQAYSIARVILKQVENYIPFTIR
jgi:CRISPR-associated protein Cas1